MSSFLFFYFWSFYVFQSEIYYILIKILSHVNRFLIDKTDFDLQTIYIIEEFDFAD